MKEILSKNDNDFNEILAIIQQAKERAFRAVNHELISMYWEIGKYVSEKVKSNAWGKSVVNEFSDFIQQKYIGIKGFSPQNIWRMKQFYETYNGNEKLSTLSREIGWSNNVLIMT
jgi:predicted nuclease of restriction endonuclease-like (RecB) superfamily